MTNEVRTAFSAAAVANAAAQVAIAAEHLVNADSSSWELVDKVYWLCRVRSICCSLTKKSLLQVSLVTMPEIKLPDSS